MSNSRSQNLRTIGCNDVCVCVWGGGGGGGGAFFDSFCVAQRFPVCSI